MSFINEKVQPEGLTFDDVLLVPAYSEVLPREVSVVTRFSRNIQLNIPIVSAAMDTVTEAPLAIALAREGGIGVIHKNMSIAEQAAHVRKVKRAENGMIYDPITISKDDTVGDALALMKENKIGGSRRGSGSAFDRHRDQPRFAVPARYEPQDRRGDDQGGAGDHSQLRLAACGRHSAAQQNREVARSRCRRQARRIDYL